MGDHKAYHHDRSYMGRGVEDSRDDNHHRSHGNDLVVGSHQQVLGHEEVSDRICLDHRSNLVEEGSYRGMRHGVDCSHGEADVDHNRPGTDDGQET